MWWRLCYVGFGRDRLTCIASPVEVRDLKRSELDAHPNQPKANSSKIFMRGLCGRFDVMIESQDVSRRVEERKLQPMVES